MKNIALSIVFLLYVIFLPACSTSPISQKIGKGLGSIMALGGLAQISKDDENKDADETKNKKNLGYGLIVGGLLINYLISKSEKRIQDEIDRKENIKRQVVLKEQNRLREIKEKKEMKRIKKIKEEEKRFNEILEKEAKKHQNANDEILLKGVKRDPSYIKNIINPSEKIQLEVVKIDPYNIKYIKNPSKSIQLFCIKKDPHTIKKIKLPSQEVQLTAVKIDATAIEHIKNPSQKVQLEAISNNNKYTYRGQAIKYIENPTPLIKNHPYVISYRKRSSNSGYSSSSSSSSTSSSYSAPQQRTCTRTRYRTEYAPGNSRRTVQVPYSEDYSC